MRRAATLMLSLFLCTLPVDLAFAQDGSAEAPAAAPAHPTQVTATSVEETSVESERKVVNRVLPVYPGWARSMNLNGSVRLDVSVAPSGKVKTISARGGHPVLVQAAESAVYKWKWTPAKQESREAIEVRFDPR